MSFRPKSRHFYDVFATSLCRLGNYFTKGLIAWKVNINIYLVFNRDKAVTYVWTYFLKAEDGPSEAMKEARKDAFSRDLFSSRSCLLDYGRTSRNVMFLNSSLLECR